MFQKEVHDPAAEFGRALGSADYGDRGRIQDPGQGVNGRGHGGSDGGAHGSEFRRQPHGWAGSTEISRQLFDTHRGNRHNDQFRSEGFPSGQRDQTVNLTALPSKVRILPPPPVHKTGHSEEFSSIRVAGVAQW